MRSFAVLPRSGPETRTALESLRRQQASVVIWGGRSEHRQVMVTAGSYELMRAEAMASLAAAGLETSGVWADIAVASASDGRAARRPVVVSMASATAFAEALQPLRDAGIRIRAVTTPAVALSSLARLRRGMPSPGAIEAYVALDEQVSCIALVRNGVLLAARELTWGYVDKNYAHTEPRGREEVTARLATAIGEFVAEIGGSPGDIGQICMCGGLPELRTMSTLLMQALDVEVEPFDSLFGIDAARLPEPADEFRERGAELRLAWAVAADWPPPINLLRARRRQVSKRVLGRVAVVAGAAAGLGGSWWVVQRSHLLDAKPPVALVAVNAPARGRGPAPTARVTRPVVNKAPVVTAPSPVVNKTPVVTAPSPVVNRAPVVTAPPLLVNKAPVVTAPPPVVNKPPAVIAPPPVVPRPPVVAPPPAIVNRAPAATTKPRETPPAPVVKRAPVAPPTRVIEERLPTPEVPVRVAPARMKPAPPPEVALPFDAVLGTILYSADRKLAIVDNRIVGVGDEVRGARVVEITAGAVMLRDAQGRLRRLALGAGGR